MGEVTVFQTGFRVKEELLRPGDIFRKADASLWEVKPDGSQVLLGSGGGSQPLTEFPFAYNTAGLNNGVVAYTFPAAGWLLNATFLQFAGDGFDGTTPLADVLVGAASTAGAFTTIKSSLGAVDLSGASDSGDWDNGSGDVYGPYPAQSLVGLTAVLGAGASAGMPLRCAAGTEILVYVSQDGLKGGAAVGGTKGAAILMLEVAAA